jgi:hypothetical protein
MASVGTEMARPGKVLASTLFNNFGKNDFMLGGGGKIQLHQIVRLSICNIITHAD